VKEFRGATPAALKKNHAYCLEPTDNASFFPPILQPDLLHYNIKKALAMLESHHEI
jgi:hypothetical protein